MNRDQARRRLEGIRRWRQAAVWSPVLWLPFLLYGLLADRLALGLAMGTAGLVFWLSCRMVVALGTCPDCGERWGRSDEAYRRAWDEAACSECGLSLFALRRSQPGDESD